MNLFDLRIANTMRDREWDPDGRINLDFFLNELAGEVGEACNIFKKIHREAMGLRGSRATLDQLADELADIGIMIDLCAFKAGHSFLMSTEPEKLNFPTYSAIGRYLFSEAAITINHVERHWNLDEFFDVVRNIAWTYGIDLMKAIPKKFNETSKKQGFSVFLDPGPSLATQEGAQS